MIEPQETSATPPPPDAPHGGQQVQPRWQRWAKGVLYALLALFLAFALLLQLPFVQNWLRIQTTTWLASQLESDVRIDLVRINGLDELRIDGLFIADYTGDTLLSAKRLYADINLNPLVLLTRGLEVEAIELHGARFFIRLPGGKQETTLDYVIRKLSSPKPKSGPSEPVAINLRRVLLTDVQFVSIDSMVGKRLFVFLQEGLLRINELNLPKNRIDVASVSLTQPIFRLDKFKGLAGDSLSITTEILEASADSIPNNRPDLWVSVDAFNLLKGSFSLHDYRRAPQKTTPAEELDFRHLDVYNIDIDLNCFSFLRDTFSGEVEHIALQDLSGFILNNLSAQEAQVSPQGIALRGLAIQTPYSQLGDTLDFRFKGYQSFEYFNDEVKIDARLHNSQVALRDIITFAPGLNKNNFFSANRQTVLQLDARISGEVNNLRGRNVFIQLADGTTLAGDFSSRNLAVRNEEYANLSLKQLRTSMRTLRQILPKFDPPDNYDRLGKIDFSGRFDGFFADFVALGQLKTDIGSATVDMRMNLKPGYEKATYSGEITLSNFNLGRWADNPDLGVVNFSSTINNGQGLTGKTATADLSAEIQSLVYKNYKYQNATLTGRLNRNFFNGDFAIKDQNIDFSFKGEVNMRDTATRFDFRARVERLAMKELNLSSQDIVLSGDVNLNLRNSKLSSMQGDVLVYDLILTKNKTDRYNIDSIVLHSFFTDKGEKVFSLESDIAQGEIRGSFDLSDLGSVWQQFMLRNFPGYAARLKLKPPRKQPELNRFTYQLELHDSKGLNWLADAKLGRIVDLNLFGHYYGDSDELKLDLSVPQLKYDNIRLVDVVLKIDLEKNIGEINVAVDTPSVGKTTFSDIRLSNFVYGDTIAFGIIYDKTRDTKLNKLKLDGVFMLQDSNRYLLNFQKSSLAILETAWDIEEDNTIIFGKKYLDIRNFVLTNAGRQILLDDEKDGGIALKLQNFDFGFIDSLWDYQSLNFGGTFNADIKVGNIFSLKNLRAHVQCDSFSINNEDFGWLSLDAEAPSLQERASAYLSLTRDTMQLIAEGFFNLGDIGEAPRDGGLRASSKQKNYFDLSLTFVSYPLRIAEYWLAGGISDTRGYFDADLRISGPPKLPDVSGHIHAKDGAFTVNFLKTRYSFANSLITANNTLFNASGTILHDKYNNQATVTGGISHYRLKDLGLRASLRTSRFLALDLQKGDNSLFYGRAIGEGLVRFSGSFQQPDIYVRATAGDSTRIVIPISESTDASALNQVRFVNKRALQIDSTAIIAGRKITGTNLEMDLTITDKAAMELIFDEQAGDIIRGKGKGNIRMLLPRTGEFEMYGDYTIEQGNYLFTLYNIVNKDFRIRRGGRIVWSGDPFRAQIKLEAEYKDLQASLANFIQEYLSEADPDLRSAASASTNVALTLLLEGELLKPNINFDIAFPQLSGQLANYADNKLRLLKQDQNELNRQVFGLIVVGQFLPADLSFRGSQVVTNTLSEFFSNQLSLLLNEFVAEVWGEENAGFNLDFAYNQYTSFLQTEGQGDLSQIGRNGLELTIRKNFLNDRLSVQLGGNVDFANNLANVTATNNGAIWGNDFAIEYVLNDARTLKLRVYQRRVPDIGGGRRLEIGSGLSWRREYSSFQEFWNGFKRQAKSVNGS